MRDQQHRLLRYGARLLALIWAGWWVLFGLLSGIEEGLNWLGTLVHTAVPGLFFLMITLFLWWREEIGGTLLVLVGILVAVWYPIMVYGRFPLATILFVLATMALPPLLSGTVCLLDWWKRGLTGHDKNGVTPTL